jgi:L-seryl-tRNA(Ser) seleniumtransferase
MAVLLASRVLAIAVVLGFVQGTQTPAPPPLNVTGVWNCTLQLENVSGRPTLTFKQEGETLTGTYAGRYGESALEGTLKEKRIHFAININAEGIQSSGTFDGTVDGDRMSGTVQFDGGGEGTWHATRADQKK